ncbi:MAG: TetR family transcriptional regulator [Candidatus Cloacimonetes bacterium HGW-Cloacimonetes-1]|jgi:AcrR family transcriptional regulator|nr:MAG: TetR family transcriptional regulator [Candidatus Cloacimonetes bacterium HGW-Cloacimonetes-1]
MELTKRQMDIVNAAILIIARMGYKELTTKNLAKQMGLTEAALYRHFDSKNDIVIAVLNYFEMLSMAVIDELNANQCPPLECIKHFVMNRYQLFMDNPDLAKVMFSEEIFKNDPAFAQQMLSIMHLHRDHIMLYVNSAQQRGDVSSDIDPLNLFRIMIGSMRLIISQWNLTGHAFDLRIEGEKLWITIEKMIKR